MRTITLLTQKGGAGKTTLCASLAIAAAKTSPREKVIALDLDPQASLTAWLHRRPENSPLPKNLTVEQIRPDQLPRLSKILSGLASKGFTTAFLDTTGVDSPATHIAIETASLCLIPTRPSTIDLTATVPSFRAASRLDRPAAFVLNCCPTQKHASRTREAATGLEHIGALAHPTITARTDHQDAISAGLGVTEYAPTGKAAEEISALWAWINKTTKDARQ